MPSEEAQSQAMHAKNSDNQKVWGVQNIHHAARAASSCAGSFSQTAARSQNRVREQQCYVPVGIRTNRDSPNLNITVNQHKSLKQRAESVLLMGDNIDERTRQIAKNVSMLAPSRFRAALTAIKDGSHFPVVWDSGASICVSPDNQ